jgi:hypothetical protein
MRSVLMFHDINRSVASTTVFLVWTKRETALPKLMSRGYAEVVSRGMDGDLALWTVKTNVPFCVVALLDRLGSIVQYTEEDAVETEDQVRAWVEDYRGWRNPLLVTA